MNSRSGYGRDSGELRLLESTWSDALSLVTGMNEYRSGYGRDSGELRLLESTWSDALSLVTGMNENSWSGNGRDSGATRRAP
ncbi:hypothetical protein BCR33DRAFT_323601 [Rhizoclosmatium globosum]|uniref:Uncharacterized protein n=1 Tax=Rhizoclosmatium globosum TaxID=329046 RepID=A0A1Y2D1Y8_9FUNG|nr:hypothetical protein BCR33DRAFT_323601 [Rhizoclosmatium globosum]|eukprot:ORY52595.1 hypothetical protein BCR33DRAFT_323601 [Rhizoclosmatium globosum]